MKTVLKFLVVAALAAAAVFFWPRISELASRLLNPAPTPVPVVEHTPEPDKPAPPPPPDLSPRTWTSTDGRTFEGALVAADSEAAIIRRIADSSLFKVRIQVLSAADQTFTREQVGRARQLNLKLGSSLHLVARKLEIKGSLAKIAAPEAEGGYRMYRIDPTYWLLLSRPLNEDDAKAEWVHVDEKTFRAFGEDTLISKDKLANFIDDKGNFSDSLPWARPEFTIVEARYGDNHTSPAFGTPALEDPNAGPANVTLQLMRLISQGKLPMAISPGNFSTQGNELTVLWRTPKGEVRQSLRNGSMLAWP